MVQDSAVEISPRHLFRNVTWSEAVIVRPPSVPIMMTSSPTLASGMSAESTNVGFMKILPARARGFREIMAQVRHAGLSPRYLPVANSAAIVSCWDSWNNMVGCGIEI